MEKRQMNPEKKKRLEAAGYVVGDIQDLLGLTPDEVKLIDLKIQIARRVKVAREKAGITQAELAKRIGSSQPRIAAAETAGLGATLDLLFRMLFAAGGDLDVGVKLTPKKGTKIPPGNAVPQKVIPGKVGRPQVGGVAAGKMAKSRRLEPVVA
jgi:DNA-binding XRE family transcriptional regulator